MQGVGIGESSREETGGVSSGGWKKVAVTEKADLGGYGTTTVHLESVETSFYNYVLSSERPRLPSPWPLASSLKSLERNYVLGAPISPGTLTRSAASRLDVILGTTERRGNYASRGVLLREDSSYDILGRT